MDKGLKVTISIISIAIIISAIFIYVGTQLEEDSQQYTITGIFSGWYPDGMGCPSFILKNTTVSNGFNKIFHITNYKKVHLPTDEGENFSYGNFTVLWRIDCYNNGYYCAILYYLKTDFVYTFVFEKGDCYKDIYYPIMTEIYGEYDYLIWKNPKQ